MKWTARGNMESTGRPDEGVNMAVENTYTVTGMTCGHCAASVREEISELGGVTNVEVNVETGAVTVASEAELARESVEAAVKEAGYALV